MDISKRIFRNKGTRSLEKYILDRNRSKKPTFLFAVTSVFAESAQSAFLLNQLLNRSPALKKEEQTRFRTFFGNSHLEALHGAIKIARHKKRLEKERGDLRSTTQNSEITLIYDPHMREFGDFFDPLNRRKKVDEALVPGIELIQHGKLAKEQIKKRGASSFVLGLCAETSEDVNELMQMCREKGIIFILDSSRTEFSNAISILEKLSHLPDVFVWGEALTDYQIPFGAFSMTHEIYEPWNNFDNCAIHSSTYGGNGLVTSWVRNYLKQACAWEDSDLKRCDEIIQNEEKKIETFCNYVNPILPLIYKMAKINLDIVKAEGAILTVKKEKGGEEDVIDCVAGYGCALWGHNPDDLDEVLGIDTDGKERHDPQKDYWGDLSQKLIDLTKIKFSSAFPAVSGASAVEIGISLAMLANPGEKRIIVFKGNYAGKALISLNGTHSESGSESAPFSPLYPYVEYVDVIQPEEDDEGKKADQKLAAAMEELEKIWDEKDIALIWFEFIQGEEADTVMPGILEFVQKNKENHGYFVGIDEVLNGIYRTGNFLSFPTQKISPDIITFPKGLSDMTFPVGATLATAQIHSNASKTNPDFVSTLENLYINQLASHIALHRLEKIESHRFSEHVRQLGKLLKEGLEQKAKPFKFIKGIKGKGLHLALDLDMTQSPFLELEGGMLDAKLRVTRASLEKGKVLLFFGRFLPPLKISQEEVQQIIEGIGKAFEAIESGYY